MGRGGGAPPLKGSIPWRGFLNLSPNYLLLCWCKMLSPVALSSNFPRFMLLYTFLLIFHGVLKPDHHWEDRLFQVTLQSLWTRQYLTKSIKDQDFLSLVISQTKPTFTICIVLWIFHGKRKKGQKHKHRHRQKVKGFALFYSWSISCLFCHLVIVYFHKGVYTNILKLILCSEKYII